MKLWSHIVALLGVLAVAAPAIAQQSGAPSRGAGQTTSPPSVSSAATAQPESSSKIVFSASAIVADMEKLVAAEKDPGPAGMGRLERALEGHFMALTIHPVAARKPLLDAIADKSKDWRFRRLAAMMTTTARVGPVEGSLLAVLRDKAERPEVRGGAALGLGGRDFAAKEAQKALVAVLREPGLDPGLQADVMRALGGLGTDDLDLMIEIANQPNAGMRFFTVTLNAVRAIGVAARRGDERAAKLLVKLLVESTPRSLYRGVILQQLNGLAEDHPKHFERIRMDLAAPLGEMLAAETAGGGELNQTLMLVAKVRPPAVADKLLELLDDSESIIVTRSATALAEMGDVRALPKIKMIVDHFATDSRFKRRWAVWNENHQLDQAIPKILNAYEKLKKAEGEKSR